jgi:hypothetical protein
MIKARGTHQGSGAKEIRLIRRQEGSRDDCAATGGTQMIEDDSLVLMQEYP